MRFRVPELCLCVAVTSCGRHPTTSDSSDASPETSAPLGDASTGPVAVQDSTSTISDRQPLIGLNGKPSLAGAALPSTGKRIFARSLRTWVYESPHTSAAKLGAIRLGGSVAVKPEQVGRDGCPGGFYAIIPDGFVCRGDDATLDENDSLVRVGAEYPPDVFRRLPYFYGTVRKPGPIYRKLPDRDERRAAEPDIDKRMKSWLAAPGEIGAAYGQNLWTDGGAEPPDPTRAWESQQSDTIPWFLTDRKVAPLLPGKVKPDSELVFGHMEPRVGYSILKTFLYEGRRYGITTDLLIVPTDRLRAIQGSSFHGFRIPEEADFPFAIVRLPGAHFFQFDREKNKLVAKGEASYRSVVKLTGKQNFFKNRLHFETAEGLWVSDKDASRLDRARKMPAWGKNGEKWIDVNVTKQTLVLYEGTNPVYATLVSTGEAGLEDAEHTTATRRGIFRIHTKYLTATMSSDEAGEEFELRDVPYVQYFEDGYALHGAYWHDRFGVPKSHGCINLAPEDARRLFFWTEPSLPTAFHAVLKPLKGTVIFVHQ